LVFSGVSPGRSTATRVPGKNGTELRIVLLNESDSLALAGDAGGNALAFDRHPEVTSIPVDLELLKNPGALRDWRSRRADFPLPVSPGQREFASAAVWKVKLPADLDMATNPILRIHYTGDVARLTLNGRLLNDDFYNGTVFEIGLRRYAPEIASGDLRLEILPLQKAMPVYFEPGCRPEFNSEGTALRIDRAEIHCTEPQLPARFSRSGNAQGDLSL
jgi:hypothetical protein